MPDSGRINAADYFLPKTKEIIYSAAQSSNTDKTDIGLEIIKRTAALRGIRKAITRLGISPNEFEQKVSDLVQKSPIGGRPDAILSEMAVQAMHSAVKSGEEGITNADVFFALHKTGSEAVKRLFSVFNIDPEDLGKALLFEKMSEGMKRIPKTTAGFAHRFFGDKKRSSLNRAWTSRPTPTLDMFSTDVSGAAVLGQAGFLVGHTEEYERMVDILSRPTKPNVILSGDPGVGKSTIVEHLAYRMAKDRVPGSLFDKRLVALDVGALSSGADQAELQSRINIIFSEIRAAGNIVLYIPEIHNLSRTSGEFFLSAANIMLPLISADDFPTIGTTYPQEFRRFIERDSAFMGAFEVIQVDELTESEAEEYLVYESIILEKSWRTTISFEAIKKAVYLAKKYFHQRPLPSSAEDILKEALTEMGRRGDKLLDAEDIITIAERKVNVPIHQAGAEEAKSLLNLEDKIHEKLIDQNEAVSAVSRSLREYRSGLSRQGGPIASFLFVGPTGVGKTELAKSLARLQFGSEEMMVRLDMSEYQEKDSISRLIGSADGRIYGNLSEAVLEKPYSLVLLDEFEKANADVLNLFLQVFDDGRLTDGLGRFVDFQNTIIISTSNAQSDFIKSSLEEGKKIDEISTEIKKRLTEQFRPELLNRFSEVIVFKTLSEEDILAITKLQMKGVAAILAENQGIDVEFDDATVALVAKEGYDPVFGARPLRAAISKLIKDPLSEKILSGEITRGSKAISSIENGKVQFTEAGE
ncbi:MAG: ATP-dependent Clp protease ATP-binding subunit [Candidatus Colwellbacteria bacterium]|nr:ATP-dependent Clp protease ATP-binding subunit [Candidatus Colwellbacteria bacterium]